MRSEVERAREALFAIPADCDRGTWLKVGMAFNEAGGSFEDFHQWSQHGGNYKGRKDVLTMWESIEPSGGITRRSLFKVAAEHGYRLNQNRSAPTIRAALEARRTEKPAEPRKELNASMYGPAAKLRQRTTDTFSQRPEPRPGFGWFRSVTR